MPVHQRRQTLSPDEVLSIFGSIEDLLQNWKDLDQVTRVDIPPDLELAALKMYYRAQEHAYEQGIMYPKQVCSECGREI